MKPKTCCFTGHRPEKLPWEFNEKDPECIKLKGLLYHQIEQLITRHNIIYFISGMDRGVDTYAAEIVLKLKTIYPVVLECAIPCEKQAVNWPEGDRERYFSIASQVDYETLIQRRFSKDCYQKRNQYMVEQSDVVLAVWDGSNGGTSRTVHYAQKKNRRILRIDPVTLNAEIMN